ncbi:MAG TPA: hypothetical protein VKZ49_09815 [Polyangiaceae bacterium]|nr:hypothetical protein [Polyangiaceae bacterium]
MGTVHALRPKSLERPEAELISAARRGQWWAKQALFERHVHAVHERAVRLLGGEGDPLRVVEQVFVEAFAVLEQQGPPGRFSTLLEEATRRRARRPRRFWQWASCLPALGRGLGLARRAAPGACAR